MSISFQVLGQPQRDNALLVSIDSGQSVNTLLFDCGDGCLSSLSFVEIQNIDYLFFSHLHMDHIGDFDSFFRCTFDRQTKPNVIWGPAYTSDILQNRFKGFLWNLHAEMKGSWLVHDVTKDKITSSRFELHEAFEQKHYEGSAIFKQQILDTNSFTVSAFVMDHKTDTLAYLVQEKAKFNIDTSQMVELGLKPGAWVQHVKNPSSKVSKVNINGTEFSVAELREKLLLETKGKSIAYLTDFLLNETVIESLSPKLSGCNIIVCEAQYLHADIDLAQKNHHMTIKYAAMLASASKAEQLVLFHVSSRYQKTNWNDLLQEAKSIFPNTSFPQNWKMN